MFHFLSAANADQRLAELERFIEFWYGPRRPEFGESDSLDLFPELPGSLRRFYAFAGRWPSPHRMGDAQQFYAGASGHHLLSIDQIRRTDDGRLRFFMEYQGDWYAVTTPGESDPPVWISGRRGDAAEDKCDRQVSGGLSKSLLTHCLMTTIYEWANSPHPRTSSHEVDAALAGWFRRDWAAAELLWEAESLGCPNY